MSRKIALLIFTLFSLTVSAQVPTNCFEIESILVDACSNPEGANEMVRFHIGASPLNVANLTVDWPNPMNPWRGICQNASTIAKTDSLNNSVLGCGLLIEPTGGVLPPDAQVIIITSEDVQALANSFANLNDTIYVIYQCSGNTSGHFVNSGASATRTLVMRFNPPLGCVDSVTYNRASLVNINGTTGGSSALQDGSSVAYAWDGTPTYYNYGCVAPFTPLLADAGNDTSICPGSIVQLNGFVQAASGSFWTSTQGSFDDSTILNPVFTPDVNATYPIQVILNAYTLCGADTTDTMLISRLVGAVSAGNDATVCIGQAATLNGSGSNSYNWTTLAGTFVSSQQSPSVNPAITTTYILTGSFGANNCPDADTVVVTVTGKEVISIVATDDSVCADSPVGLTAAGGSSYLWSPNDGTISNINSPTPTVTPSATQTYTVMSSGACADTASILITVIPGDTVTITASDTAICLGDTVHLDANGASSYTWSPDDGSISDVNSPSPTITPTATTTYTVTSGGACAGTASILITIIPEDVLSITASNPTPCEGDTIQLTATGSTGYQWSPATSLSCTNCDNPTAIATNSITYTVTSTGACPSLDSIEITPSPNVTISASGDTTILITQSAPLTASGGSDYEWTPETGLNTSAGANVIATPQATTTYYVTDPNNSCASTDSVTVTVIFRECPVPAIPTAFSPNGDNANETFGLVNFENFSNIELHIYNRWGEEVFIGLNNQKWDGSYKDVAQPISTFAYTLRATCDNGDKVTLNGCVTLLR